MARLPTVLADRIAHAARSRGIDPERAGDLAGLLDALAASVAPGSPGPGGPPAAAVLAAGAVVAQLFSYDRSLSTDPDGAASDPGAADRWI